MTSCRNEGNCAILTSRFADSFRRNGNVFREKTLFWNYSSLTIVHPIPYGINGPLKSVFHGSRKSYCCEFSTKVEPISRDRVPRMTWRSRWRRFNRWTVLLRCWFSLPAVGIRLSIVSFRLGFSRGSLPDLGVISFTARRGHVIRNFLKKGMGLSVP